MGDKKYTQLNDRLGLAGHWFDVPASVERPQSAIDYDLKAVRVKAQYAEQFYSRYAKPSKRTDVKRSKRHEEPSEGKSK